MSSGSKQLLGFACLVLGGCSTRHETDLKVKPPVFKQEQTASPQLLRKLSLHLEGRPPSADEYQQLNQNPAQEYPKLLEAKLNSGLFTDKMVNRYLDHMWLAEERTLPSWNANRDERSDSPLNLLVREVLQKNLPWDELILSTKFPPQEDLPEESLAGVITTERFFSRYWTNSGNGSRKRAAAIYRIFLCDPMEVVVPSVSDAENTLNEIMFPRKVGSGKTSFDQHGKESQCWTCHRKLEPIARIFDGSEVRVSTFSRTSHLALGPVDNQRDIPIKGFRGLGTALKSADEYLTCQAQLLTRWFWGEDEKISESRLQELKVAFDMVGRKPRDFVRFLVQQPEFTKFSASPQLPPTPVEISAIFQNCDQCHSNLMLTRVPRYAQSAPNDIPVWERFVRITDLLNDGKKAQMPPASSSWQLRTQDRQNLLRWFRSTGVVQ